MKYITRVEDDGITYEEDVNLGDVHDELENLDLTLSDIQRRMSAILTSVNGIGWVIAVVLLCHVLHHW